MLRASLFHIADEFLPKHVGTILYELLHNHPPHLAQDSSYRTVAFFLNGGVNEASDRELTEFMREQLNTPAPQLSELELARKKHGATLSRFTRDQAQVIRDWLALAAEWECSRPWRFEMDAARSFWSELLKK